MYLCKEQYIGSFIAKRMSSDNILSVLDGFALENTETIAKKLADDFRHRRIEKNMTREQVARKAGIAVSNVIRFEQKGLISLGNLIALALSMGYMTEVANVFAQPKYSTMEELTQIRKNVGKKKAYGK